MDRNDLTGNEKRFIWNAVKGQVPLCLLLNNADLASKLLPTWLLQIALLDLWKNRILPYKLNNGFWLHTDTVQTSQILLMRCYNNYCRKFGPI